MTMTASKSRNNFGLLRLALIVAAASLLAGCETDGNTPGPLASLTASKPAEPEKPAEPPMTRQRAAEQCWMSTEKGSAKANLDKRADIVDKCIDDKLKMAAAAPKS
jgi:hypothetical protein